MTTTADLIVARLLQAGVSTLFGVPGGGSTLDLIEAASHAGLPFVLTATETAGAIAAVAQAEITGRPGACLTALGPGVASAVDGIACASLDRAPLVLFTDAHPSSSDGAFEHQRIDHAALLAPIVKWSATIDARHADETMRRAIACAIAGPPGPVHIDCPADETAVQVASGVAATREMPAATASGSMRVDARSAESPSPGLRRSGSLELPSRRRPLLIVGLGARRAEDAAAIREFCETHDVPAMVTYKGKGVLPDDDAHFAGVFTNGAIERSIAERSDLLIGVGLDPVEVLPRQWTYAQPIVACSRWRVDDRHVPFASQWIGDIGDGLRTLGTELSPSAWDLGELRRTVDAQRERLRAAGDRLTADRVVGVANRMAAEARVTVDAGAHMFPATMLWRVSRPSDMLISNGLSTMGFALPAAIGAALIDRERPVVALIGDGGLLMCAGELLTAARERLHIIVIVFSDGALSLIDVKQRQRRFRPNGVMLGDVAWASVAESFRMTAHAATTERELRDAIERALSHRGPTLIDCRIDPAGYDDTLRAVRG
jgi:acetolactate synthase-1/2/3 large subunit